MSVPIFRLLADDLDISDQKAKKLFSAMLREVKKRARHEGVRLPDLGKFKERNGRLTFEPSESLARAVNHRFEGLSSEDLKGAPGQEEEEEKDDSGPSTITLGYQDSSWSPLDSSEGETTNGTEAEDEDDGADTEEFQVPDAESAADTDELDVGTTGSAAASSEPVREERSQSASRETESSSQTEELYPLVEDEPKEDRAEPSASTSTRSAADDDTKREHLSGIWDSDPDASSDRPKSSPSEETTGGAALDDIPTDPGDFDKDPPSDEPDASSQETSTEPTPTDRAPKESADGGSSTWRVFVALLVLLLLGGGAWYILGQRGMVPPPRPVLAQLQTQVQSMGNSISAQLFASSSGNASAPDGQQSEDASTTTTSGTTGQNNASASSEATGTQQSSEATRSINPSEGGWSIIVASRTDRAAASSLADTYRDRFSGQQVPVDVIPGNVENATRFRVGVGQFSSQTDAQSFLSKFGSKLPDGAWALNLQ